MPTVIVLSGFTSADRPSSSVVAVSSAVVAHRLLAQARSTSAEENARERAILARPEDISLHVPLIQAWGREVDAVYFESADFSDPNVQRQVWVELCERALYFSPKHHAPLDSCDTPEPA